MKHVKNKIISCWQGHCQAYERGTHGCSSKRRSDDGADETDGASDPWDYPYRHHSAEQNAPYDVSSSRRAWSLSSAALAMTAALVLAV